MHRLCGGIRAVKVPGDPTIETNFLEGFFREATQLEIHTPLYSLQPFLGLIDRTAYLCDKSSGKDVLHVGCADYPLTTARMGDESFLHRRLTSVARRCIGVDLSEEAIGLMREAGFDNVEVGDACRLSERFQNEFDVIVAGEVLEHIPNPALFLDEARKTLKPGGVLLVTVPNAFNFLRLLGLLKNSESVHVDHCYYFSAKTLARLAGCCGFQLEEVGYTDPLVSARYHFGITELWRFLIRRFPVFGQSVAASLRVGSPKEATHLVIK